MISIAVFASGSGSNLQTLIDHVADGSLPARIALLITNNSKCGSVERARQAGIPVSHISTMTHPDPQALGQAMVKSMEVYGVDLVVLAGYMKKVPEAVLARFPERILNIHPALLPNFGGHGHYGIHVHEAVLAAGAKVSGVTVHLVDGDYDRGAILAQRTAPVLPGDDPDTLQKRVLVQEHWLYWRVVRAFALGQAMKRTAPAYWLGEGAVRTDWDMGNLDA